MEKKLVVVEIVVLCVSCRALAIAVLPFRCRSLAVLLYCRHNFTVLESGHFSSEVVLDVRARIFSQPTSFVLSLNLYFLVCRLADARLIGMAPPLLLIRVSSHLVVQIR